MKSSTRNKGYKPWRCRQWWIPYRKWGISFHGLSRGCSVTQSKRGCQPCYLFSWEAKSYMLPHQNCAPLLCFHLIFNAFPFPFTCNNPVPHCPHIIERKKNRWGGKYRKWAAITPLLSSFRQYTETPLSPWLQQKRVISKAATTVCLACSLHCATALSRRSTSAMSKAFPYLHLRSTCAKKVTALSWAAETHCRNRAPFSSILFLPNPDAIEELI